MHAAAIYTHISWWVYRTLKTDQSFSTPRSPRLSSPSLHTFLCHTEPIWDRLGAEVGGLGGGGGVHLCCLYTF